MGTPFIFLIVEPEKLAVLIWCCCRLFPVSTGVQTSLRELPSQEAKDQSSCTWVQVAWVNFRLFLKKIPKVAENAVLTKLQGKYDFGLPGGEKKKAPNNFILDLINIQGKRPVLWKTKHPFNILAPANNRFWPPQSMISEATVDDSDLRRRF